MMTKMMLAGMVLIIGCRKGEDINPKEQASTTPIVDAGEGSTDPSAATTATDEPTPVHAGACLADNCNSPGTPPALNLNFSSLEYFPGTEANCSLGDYQIIKSKQANRMTLLYRANYDSLGRWQLYARNILVAADGTMSFPGEKVNLLESCNGNVNGVTSFVVSEYADSDPGTTRKFALDNVEEATAVKVAINCINTAQSQSKVIDLATLNVSAAATKPFLQAAGAVGYWAAKNEYLLSDGKSLKPDGTVGTTIVPGFSPLTTVAGLPFAIPDNSSIEKSVTLAGTGNVTAMTIQFSLSHSSAGELGISLCDSDGNVLNSEAFSLTGSNISQTISLPFSSRALAGTWKVRISDYTAQNTGTVYDLKIGPAPISKVLGEDSNGIYLSGSTGNLYVNNNMTVSASTVSKAVGSFVDPVYGLVFGRLDFARYHESIQTFSRWADNGEVATSTDLISYRSGDYGKPNNRSCQYDSGYSNDLCLYPKLATLAKSNKAVLWFADKYQGGMMSLNLANGTADQTVLNSSALTSNSDSHEFLGARLVMVKNQTSGVVFLSNEYFK